MLIRRLFGLYDCVTATLEKRDDEKVDYYSSCFCEIMIVGFVARVLFYPDRIRWRVNKIHDCNNSHEGIHQYLNTSSETIDSLVSTIVKHVGNGSKN